MIFLVLMTPERVYGKHLVHPLILQNGSFQVRGAQWQFFSKSHCFSQWCSWCVWSAHSSLPARTTVHPTPDSAACEINLESTLTAGHQTTQHIHIFHSSSHFSAAKGCVKQIYDAPSLSAFPLFHGSVASHGRRGEVFSRCSLVAALPSQQHFHSYTGRSFSAPFFFSKITHCHHLRETAAPGRGLII